MSESILQGLNKAQSEAAEHIDGPLLILAGAGSGKTKTITTRIAYLISLGIDPSSILTLTFTNKAAKEMSHRALGLISGDISYPPILSTFHKFGLLFLKFHISHLDRSNNFVIIDTDDKKRIIKSLNDTEISNKHIANEISRFKNSLIDTDANIDTDDRDYEKISNIYKTYEKYLLDNNLVDFDDLLALPYKILDSNKDLCKNISNRYKYIMVDEYQDTNDLQYKLLQKLCSSHNNLCVVGDDDQSIYGWRGANVENILDFPKYFEKSKVINLDINYRSTNQILKMANNLIDYNKNRMPKKLTSFKGDGAEVKFLESRDEKFEAKIIASKIQKLIARGVDTNQIAILFRINALSRSIEEGLNKAGIAYKMVGGVKFYERMEIKDILSYLRFFANPTDDYSLRRIINRPKRGIGKVTIDKIEKAAYDSKKTIYHFLKENFDEVEALISKKASNTLKEFVFNLDSFISKINDENYDLSSLCEDLDSTFEIRKFYSATPEAIEKIPNIDEFYALFKDRFIKDDLSLEQFLNEISLQNDQDQIDNNYISIMSIHAAKGLEFEHLFVIGLEEGFFPLLGDGSDIEEERRLGYVAITRSKENLLLGYCQSRFYKGRRSDLLKSRFLQESGLVKGGHIPFNEPSSYKKGDLVKHKVFGIGRVVGVDKIRKEYKLKINFGGNQKEILSSFVHRV